MLCIFHWCIFFDFVAVRLSKWSIISYILLRLCVGLYKSLDLRSKRHRTYWSLWHKIEHCYLNGHFWDHWFEVTIEINILNKEVNTQLYVRTFVDHLKELLHTTFWKSDTRNDPYNSTFDFIYQNLFKLPIILMFIEKLPYTFCKYNIGR